MEEDRVVKLATGLTFGTEPVDWQQGIDTTRMRAERMDRARQVLRRHNIPAILATRGDNCRYLSGLRGPEFMPQLWYVLFFAEHDPVVFANAGWLSQMPDQAPWITHWRLARSWMEGACGPEATREEARRFASEIHRELDDRRLAGERLGIVGFDSMARNALGEAGLALVEAWPLMLEARAVKTDDEINCLKTLAAICDAAWYRIIACARPGMRDTELSRIASHALYEAGAQEVPPVTVFSGPLSFDGGPSRTGRIIQRGDTVAVLMCGAAYLGYKSCMDRTFVMGATPGARERDWHRRLLERLDAVIAAIRPGATTADAARHFLPASTWGYHDEAQVLTLECGHGIGLHSPELPIVNRQWSLTHPQIFEPGMTLAVEGREGERRVGGVWLENMLVVTAQGTELIDHTPRDEILECLA